MKEKNSQWTFLSLRGVGWLQVSCEKLHSSGGHIWDCVRLRAVSVFFSLTFPNFLPQKLMGFPSEYLSAKSLWNQADIPMRMWRKGKVHVASLRQPQPVIRLPVAPHTRAHVHVKGSNLKLLPINLTDRRMDVCFFLAGGRDGKGIVTHESAGRCFERFN